MALEPPYHIVVKHIDEILNKHGKGLTAPYIYPVEAIDEIRDYLYDYVAHYEIDSISSIDGMYCTYAIALPHPDDFITIPFMFHAYSY